MALIACGNSGRPAATISDPNFVKQANAVCRATVPRLRAPDRKATSTTVLRASTLDATADGVAAVARRLRTIPVEAGSAARVRAWLADWDRFVVVGHRYAAAVKADDPGRYTKIDDQAIQLAERIGTFARGNRIDDCVL
ncbi:MAG: hypothetical protein QOJ09_1659 [Actinomycetota bacterium]|jgi:hypothetical protein|nr:hypothetical protein [Actinomycetota bacterium]